MATRDSKATVTVKSTMKMRGRVEPVEQVQRASAKATVTRKKD